MVNLVLKIMSETVGRVIERGVQRALQKGSSVDLDVDPLWLHEGNGRPAPTRSRSGRRVELDDRTVTWGTGGGHCCVWVEAHLVYVRDLGSDNGTWITRDGEEARRIIPNVATALIPGDTLGLGAVALLLIADGPAT